MTVRRGATPERRHLSPVPARTVSVAMSAITDPAWPTWDRCDVCRWPVDPATAPHANCYPTRHLRSV